VLDERAFNVGTGTETSVNTLARHLIDASGRTVEVSHAPARPGELQRSCLATEKLRGLGWAPQRELRDGLADTYEWIAAHGVR
jgi:UDP-glucose 4-epimerase